MWRPALPKPLPYDTEWYAMSLRTQHYVWSSTYAPEWYRRVSHKLHNLKWFLLHRLHPKHRYHIINTGLGYGFRDTDTIMEAVLVKLLIEFVEIEDPFNHFDTTQDRYAEMWKEMRELYDFFKQNDYREVPPEELTIRLKQIIDLRSHMWT